MYLSEKEIQWALQIAQHKILYSCGNISQGHIALSSYKCNNLIAIFEPLLMQVSLSRDTNELNF